MYSIFIAINAESIRKTVITNGYPEDNVYRKWRLKDITKWICICIDNEDAEISS
jgi:hypothetical protein